MSMRGEHQLIPRLLRLCLVLPALLLLLTVHFASIEKHFDVYTPRSAPHELQPLPTLPADHFLNTGTTDLLDALPGIGPALAQSIVNARDAQGGHFAFIEDLLAVPGIGEKKLDSIRTALTTPSASPSPSAASVTPPPLIHSESTPPSTMSPDLIPELPPDHLLNTSDLSDLDALPGVGPVLAQRIIDTRTASGPFRFWDDLLTVPGVGEKKLDDIRQALTAPSATTAPTLTPASPTDAPVTSPSGPPAPLPELPPDHLLNTGDLSDLDALPGVGPVLAQRIIDTRTASGPFRFWDDLLTVPGIGEKKLDDIRQAVENAH